MIDTKELRIGHFIKANNLNAFRIDEIRLSENQGYIARMNFPDTTGPGHIYMDLPISEADPIPLTEKLIISCGFNKIEYPFSDGSGSLFGYESDMFETFILKCNPLKPTHFILYHFGQEIKSLHQLQNILFDLYREELEVKL